jgi:hypothetical protein
LTNSSSDEPGQLIQKSTGTLLQFPNSQICMQTGETIGTSKNILKLLQHCQRTYKF